MSSQHGGLADLVDVRGSSCALFRKTDHRARMPCTSSALTQPAHALLLQAAVARVRLRNAVISPAMCASA